jgi:pyrroloquinoline quinone biosynthesis protein B
MRAMFVLLAAMAFTTPAAALDPTAPPVAAPIYLVVLGNAQDGGAPQAGSHDEPGWKDPAKRRYATCLAIVDDEHQQRWLFDATPNFPEQLEMLDEIAPREGKPGLSGIFLSHAHMGHYTGLMWLGKEVMGAAKVPVYAMPRKAGFLRANGPWSQLVRLENIELHEMKAGEPVLAGGFVRVTPLLVPHRQEYSEVVGFRIEAPGRTVLFIPDIDSWEQWDALGTRVEDEIRKVDVAYLDATFYANGEIPGRDMSGFPHPFIRHSMERFASLPASEKAKVRFIHLNHTNHALWAGTPERAAIEAAGFHVAEQGERLELAPSP